MHSYNPSQSIYPTHIHWPNLYDYTQTLQVHTIILKSIQVHMVVPKCTQQCAQLCLVDVHSMEAFLIYVCQMSASPNYNPWALVPE
jgi:hypothetical protein